jgi:hypothetical protein
MFARDSPRKPGAHPTLVAITMSALSPRDASHRPMIVSDSPPWLPGAQNE